MLTQIICDRFADEFKIINFHAGLNTVLGSTSGSNALGKSTFLWIIDFVFGGNGYCSSGSDIQQNVKDHTIYFTFLFDETHHYFHRNTATPQIVSRCDMGGNLIKRMSLDEYRKFLAENYHLGIPFEDITAHFFRVYGKENTYEKNPYLTKLREADEKAVDFLLKLFGKGTVLTALRTVEDEMGIKESKWVKAKQNLKSFEMIEQNEVTIASLEKRLKQLMEQNGRTGIQYLGLGNDSFENILKLQKELRSLTRRREQLKIRLDVVQNGNRDFINTPIAEDFQELTDFFPGANIKELSQIESFHRQLHVILQREIDEEVERLRPLIDRCERDIAHIAKRLEVSGIAAELTQRILTQGVNITRQIEKLREENCQLAREKELQEQRILLERRLEKLIADRVAATEEVVSSINGMLSELNTLVTGGKETAPVLEINRQKGISFVTRGNTSEGTACKSMVLYDLSILTLTNVPVLIHDSNILHSISREHLKATIRLYQTSGKQIFIAMDRESLDNLADSVVLELSEDHKLFGYSWSREKT